ncbi:F-box/WD repeat-containing protein 4 [Drosophila takahashii]|uniref:F-box/WD repeat-containing protein 4 n=1 Tax=Drosophila takahashii TaxID=29030 RepID=UPI001CF865C9|nr:F-box/WD repeat-containing protein 4 [Drosophila takahashii]
MHGLRMSLKDLTIDCLLCIFDYCSEADLLCLCKADAALEYIIDTHYFHPLAYDLLLSGHRNSPRIEQRNRKRLKNYERLEVSRNWVSGTYFERPYFHHAQMFPTKLCLESDYLYITHAGYLRKYRRTSHDALERRYEEEITTSTQTDISDFVKKQSTIFAGRVCGSCFHCDVDEPSLTEQRMHPANEYLYCVDFVNDLYATSTDNCCRLWQRSEEFGMIHFDMVTNLPHAFRSMKLSSDGQWLYGGLYSDKATRRALKGVHVESGEEIVFNSSTMSIYDLKLKDDQVIFTANFDTTFRMFDRRIDRDVAIWEDPFDSSFYSLEYDGLYGVLVGTNRHSRVNLYDIRMKKYVQLYFPSRTREHKGFSPVYSLACDSQYMFVATDHNLRVFDFKSNRGIRRDYSNINVLMNK